MVKLVCAIVGQTNKLFGVNVGGTDSLHALKNAIKSKKLNDMENVAACDLELYLAKKGGAWLDITGAAAVTLDGDGHPRGFDEINPTLWIQNDKYFGKNFQPEEGQIHVLVVLPELQQGVSLHEGGARFPMMDEEEYERMVTEDSYAKYLSAIAETVAYFYKFDYEFETFPTINDVFYALKEGVWEFRLEEGNPLTAVELPKFFTEDEWNELKEMNDVLHDGKMFTTITGKPFIVLPHDLYDEDLVAALKNMAITTNIVSDATELEVYDEEEF